MPKYRKLRFFEILPQRFPTRCIKIWDCSHHLTHGWFSLYNFESITTTATHTLYKFCLIFSNLFAMFKVLTDIKAGKYIESLWIFCFCHKCIWHSGKSWSAWNKYQICFIDTISVHERY